MQIAEGSAPEELQHLETYNDLMGEIYAEGNATVQLPSMLLLLYELTMCAFSCLGLLSCCCAREANDAVLE